MRNLCAATLFALVAAPAALATPSGDVREAANLKSLLPHLDKFLAIPGAQRDKLDLDYRFSYDDRPIETGEMWLVLAGKDTPLTFTDGQIDWKSLAPHLSDNPKVYTRLGKGKGAITLEVSPRLNLKTRMETTEIEAAIDQVNSAIKKQAGMMSMFAPKMKGVSFSVDEGTEVSFHHRSGKIEALTVKDKAVAFTPGRKWQGALVFTKAPQTDEFIE